MDMNNDDTHTMGSTHNSFLRPVFYLSYLSNNDDAHTYHIDQLWEF